MTKRTLIVIACVYMHVTRTVKVPEPVYERLSDEARKEDVSRGAILKIWLNKADAYETVFSEVQSKMSLMNDLEGLIEDLYMQAEYAKASDDIPNEYAEMQEQLGDQLIELIDDDEY